MRIRGRNASGDTVWFMPDGHWSESESDAGRFHEREAERFLRVINANNRFLDREDRVEATIQG